MIVVADTSPVNYLIQIRSIDILQALYGRILIPRVVHEELLHPSAPVEVRGWANRFPGWCEVVEARSGPAASLSVLDAGGDTRFSLLWTLMRPPF